MTPAEKARELRDMFRPETPQYALAQDVLDALMAPPMTLESAWPSQDYVDGAYEPPGDVQDAIARIKAYPYPPSDSEAPKAKSRGRRKK